MSLTLSCILFRMLIAYCAGRGFLPRGPKLSPPWDGRSLDIGISGLTVRVWTVKPRGKGATVRGGRSPESFGSGRNGSISLQIYGHFVPKMAPAVECRKCKRRVSSDRSSSSISYRHSPGKRTSSRRERDRLLFRRTLPVLGH
ncbi:hypothetical protein BHE74_00051724 [Ensete ventricosum]|nr:hypothetical protein BHE74_00051724 [Ensete ventricosum]